MTDEIPRKMLIVRMGAIGDVVNALVFATAVKDARPETEIGWVVHQLSAPLVTGHPAVDRVHLWRKEEGWLELSRVLVEVRREKYDLAVDLQRITKSAMLARWSGATRVLGYDRKRSKEGSWLWTKEHIPGADGQTHMVEQYLAFARHLGIENPAARHVLPEDSEAEEWADAKLDELGEKPILVSLGATKPANRWIPERFGEVAHACWLEFSDPVCLVGGPAEEADAARVMGVVGRNTGVVDLVGATTLPQLVALTRRARLLIGLDTGPMHVAAACGIPVVALFGPADPDRTGPWGAIHRVVRTPPECAPCNRRTCNQPRHACMEDITVEHVLEAARDRLAVV